MTAAVDTRTWESDLVDALSKLDDVPREKTADTGSYTYRYADLADLLGYVRPILAEHGFVVTQPVGGVPGEVSVGTVLFHRTGATFTSPLIVAKVAGTPQSIGSATTYLRRYSLLATLGLATEDDDGAAASRQAAAPRRRSTSTTSTRTKTPRERMTARAVILAKELGYVERQDRLDLASSVLGRKIESLNDADDDELRRIVDYFDREANGPDEPSPDEEGY